MPQNLTPPIYGASQDGLSSRISATFSGDNQIYLPLHGMFQGDPVKPACVFIDNYNNQLPINFTVGGKRGFVPAYTSQYIDASYADGVMLSTTASVTINIEVHDRMFNGTISRGIGPSGNFDSYWSSVVGLWHFLGTLNQTTAADSRNSGFRIGDGTKGLITTNFSQFQQGSCAYSDGTSLYNQGETLPFPAGLNATLECSVIPLTANTFNVIQTYFGSANSGSVTTGIAFAYRPDGTGKVRYEAWHYSNGVSTMIAASGYTYGINDAIWHQLALVLNGTWTFFVDGVSVGTNSSLAPISIQSTYLFTFAALYNGPSGQMVLAESRITAAVRYTANYTPLAAPFPNQ